MALKRGRVLEQSLIKRGIQNVKYVLLSQFIWYTLGFFISFVVPGLLGVRNNAYYQTYILFTTYIGILHFGFNDGIYLKYGSYDYDQLPKGLFRSYMRFYLAFTSVEILVLTGFMLIQKDPGMRFASFFAILDILVVNASKMFNNINQVTGRMKIYSFVVVAENLQILVLVIILIFLNQVNFYYVIAADFAAKCVVLVINIYRDRDIVFGKAAPFRVALGDCFDTIRVGIKLMIPNFMAMIIIDLGQFILKFFGSKDNFSTYAFAVDSLNLGMMFIAGVSLVVYPILCRLDKKLLPNYFVILNRLLSAIIFTMILMYYPLSLVIQVFLPKYASTLGYLYLLFPSVIMQSKLQLLINTYYKSLRLEKTMLYANLSSIAVFLLIAVPLYAIFHTIQMIAWATLITLAWRCYASEFYLKRKMGITSYRNIGEELVMAAAFIVTTGFVGGVWGLLIYVALLAIYMAANMKEIVSYSKKFVAVIRR